MNKQINKTDPTPEENLAQQNGDTPQGTTEATQGDTSTVNDQSSTDTPDDAQDTPQDDEPTGGKANREAANYRTKLRAAEVELETARTNRDQLATQVIEQILPSHVPPNVFWKLTDGVNTFLGDDGLVDPSVVEAAAKQVAEDLGIQKQRGGPVIPSQADMPSDVSTGNSYAAAFGPKH